MTGPHTESGGPYIDAGRRDPSDRTRRSVINAAVWSVPVIAVAAVVPDAAASTTWSPALTGEVHPASLSTTQFQILFGVAGVNPDWSGSVTARFTDVSPRPPLVSGPPPIDVTGGMFFYGSALFLVPAGTIASALTGTPYSVSLFATYQGTTYPFSGSLTMWAYQTPPP